MSNEININLNNFIKKLMPEAIDRGLEKAGQLLENKAVEQLNSGRNKAWDTGFLANSMTHTPPSNSKVKVGTNCDYADKVHDGTSSMQARPFLRDAVDENMDGILRCFENLI